MQFMLFQTENNSTKQSGIFREVALCIHCTMEQIIVPIVVDWRDREEMVYNGRIELGYHSVILIKTEKRNIKHRLLIMVITPEDY